MEKNEYELTNPQKSIWVTEGYYQGTSVNTICGYVFISDAVDFAMLQKAIYEMVKENEGMRLQFKFKNNSCVQYVEDFKPFTMDMVSLASEKELEAKALAFANTPLFKENSPLFQFLLFKLPNGSGGFLVNVHHFIGDSWSLGLIAKEVTEIYGQLLANNYEEKEYPSYCNYIHFEKTYQNSEKWQKDKAYWNEVFQTVPETASIPSIKNTSSQTISCKGNRAKYLLSEKDLTEIKTFCTSHQISVYNFFMAVYSLYVARVSRLNDFVMGTPILNRTNFEQKQTMGMFISVAPLRVQVDETASFVDFAKKIATDIMALFRHQKYSYQSILEDLREKDSSIPNLYNVILSYQITKTIEENSQVHYSTDWVFNGCAADELQIHLFDLNDENQMTIAYDYKADKFDTKEIDALHARILTMIHQIMKNNEIGLKDIEIVTPEEKHQILYDFNDTYVDYPRDKTIVDFFEEQVEKTPDKIAVVFEDKQLTYQELNEKANQLARVLVKNGVTTGDIVGIYFEKSMEVVVSMLSILKAGAAFLPLDVDYPLERLEYILNHAKPKTIVSSRKFSIPTKITTIFADFREKLYQNENVDNLKISLTPEDLMYVMYTSGSTGSPKGVMVKHKNIIRLAMFPNFIHFDRHEVMVQTGTTVFDACIFEIFGSLLHGFELHLLKKEQLLDTNYFANFLKEKKVTILFLTTGLFNQLGIENANLFCDLKYLLTGGDVISKVSVQNILKACPGLKLLNCYGPTENGSYSTVYEITGKEDIIPIGKPITNSSCYVMADNHLCPIGVPGELLVGGDGVAKGYLNNEKLTARQFIANPFGSGLVYRTGDLVRWLSDGNIEFLGRLDDQVKVRGFRIELSEIDQKILSQNSHMKQSLTVVQTIHGSKTICSYFVADEKIDCKQLKNSLSQVLPSYMVPTFLMQLKDFPLNINGKIAIKQLPIPEECKLEKVIVPARNELDKIILDTFRNVLGGTNISITDSFFDLGGDSLSAITFTSLLSQNCKVKVTVQDVFHFPVFEQLSDYLTTLTQHTEVAIKPAKKRDYYPTSSAQKRIYYAASADENSILYNIAGGIVFDTPLDVLKLQECFSNLIERHEALRTCFQIVDDEIVQVIKEQINFTLPVETSDSDDLNEIYSHFVKPFDLKSAPLFRAKAVNLTNGKMLLLMDMHHIISDGTSVSILLKELCDLYQGINLRKKEVNYKEFAIWEKDQFETEEFQKSKEFWLKQYQDEIPLLNMPTSFARPSSQSFEGSNYHFTLSHKLYEKIHTVAKKLEMTPYMLFLSIYHILLSKYSSQDDIVIGTPIVGRELPQLNDMVGMFVNTLALRNKVDHKNSFDNFAKQIKENCLAAFDHQNYPFDHLVKDLKIKRDTSRNPLFDVMFIYQNNGYPTLSFDKVKAEYFIPDNAISKFDLSLEVIPIHNEYQLRFEYCTKLFDEEFIERLASHYLNILTTVLENTEIKIAEIDMLSEEEKHQILYEFNDTAMDYPRDKTIVDLFEEQVEKTPDKIAVVYQNKKITYAELEQYSNQLANYLYNIGIRKGDIVCTLLPRSTNLIITILAILKCGGIYLPISTTYPSNRINYIVENSKAKLMITNTNFSTNSSIPCIKIDKNEYQEQSVKIQFQVNYSIEDTIYIIYTSGSTGNPKGVQITNKNLNNFIHSFQLLFDKSVSCHDICLSTTSITFDVSIWEIFFTLLNGATLDLYEKETIDDIFDYCNTLIKHHITMAYIPPNILDETYQILDKNRSEVKLSKILIGVEPIKTSSMLKYFSLNPNLKIVNGYGPTETTICTTAFQVSLQQKNHYSIIPIGKPLNNMNAYVLDDDLSITPIGIPGELYVSGDNVGKGYLNNSALTKDRFIPCPFKENTIMYKTGDIVKWLPDGNLLYLGRNDNQIKVKGHRIEINEIVNAISEYPTISKCVVLVKKQDDNKLIVAYFTATKEVSINDLRSFLTLKLPFYNIPNFFVQLDKFTLTSNGKVDVNSLHDIPLELNTDYELPRNDFEKKLVELWKQFLNVEKIGINDNFFDLGGDSLIAIRLQIEAFNSGISLSYGDIFTYPTIKQLSEKAKSVKAKVNIKDFNYTKINDLLSQNTLPLTNSLKKIETGNVLLTGVTGFVGIHILDKLLSNTNCTVYCLVRNKDNIDYISRLKRTLQFYFNDKYDNLLGTRIKVVEGDIIKAKLGLTHQNYEDIGNDISCVINSAAIVKHYGKSHLFDNTNIDGVKNIINFCSRFHIKLYHISTLSVSGNVFAEDNFSGAKVNSKVLFKEDNLYVNQDLSNIYIYTKFMAEKIILDFVVDGKLNATIIRLGNITNRLSDGKFQINISENAFLNRLLAFIRLKCIPDYLMKRIY